VRAKRFNFLIRVKDNDTYEHVLDFYEGALGMERIHGWDRADSKGAVLSVGGNAAVEILGPPEGATFDVASLEGAAMSIELETAQEIDRWYEKLISKGIPVAEPPQDQAWGARLFSAYDPAGVKVSLFAFI
jgi:uncharacterized glyoxalase superfamily protein PhnB